MLLQAKFLCHNANESLSGIETLVCGLRHYSQRRHNANESLSGIETDPNFGAVAYYGVTMPMNPYQGLKLQPPLGKK